MRSGRLMVVVALIAATTIWIDDRVSEPSLTAFDPARMGRLEASMWRSYYEHAWPSLVCDGLRVSCGEYGLSWWDGVRGAVLAAQAAYYFRSDTNHPRCPILLERYYTIIRSATGRDFDTAEAARLELEWWQMRRRKVDPAEYGETIADNLALVYGLETAALLPASVMRAEAMHYRDHHGRSGEMTEESWAEVARRLESAYAALRVAATAH